MHHNPPSTREMDEYVAGVGELVARSMETRDLVPAIVELNERLLASKAPLPDHLLKVRPEVPYTRNLVHQDPAGKFSIIVILWGPFQETRVHDHLNWGVVSMLEGTCLAVDYDRRDDASDPHHADLVIRQTSLASKGSLLDILPPPRSNIHKMANAGRDLAVSLHTYGDPGSRARVFDPASGKVEILDLVFHNR